MMGVPVIKNLHPSQFEIISNWLESDEKVKVDFPDQTRKIIRKIFEIKVQSVIWQNYYDLNCQLEM
jgi:hypothetical protein